MKSYQTDSTMRTMTLHSYSESDMQAYARACVSSATAAKDAALEAARENAERYRAMRDEFLWSMVSNTERTDLTLHMPGVSLAAIGPNSDEFDAAIDAARAATSGEGMGEAASAATRF